MKLYILIWTVAAGFVTMSSFDKPRSAPTPSPVAASSSGQAAHSSTCDCADICKKVPKEEQCGIELCNAKTGK